MSIRGRSKYPAIPGYPGYIEFAEAWGIHINTVRAHMHQGYCAWPRVIKTGKTRHRLYNTWENMLQRCYNPNHPQYRYWGGRGIEVCNSWRLSFEQFVLDMGPKPGPSYSLDRADNAMGYNPENCRWATKTEQVRNRRPYGKSAK